MKKVRRLFNCGRRQEAVEELLQTQDAFSRPRLRNSPSGTRRSSFPSASWPPSPTEPDNIESDLWWSPPMENKVTRLRSSVLRRVSTSLGPAARRTERPIHSEQQGTSAKQANSAAATSVATSSVQQPAKNFLHRVSLSFSPRDQRTTKPYHSEQWDASAVQTGSAAAMSGVAHSVPQPRRQFPGRVSMNLTPGREANMRQVKSKSQKNEEELLQATSTPQAVSVRGFPPAVHQQRRRTRMIPSFGSLQATTSRHPIEPSAGVVGDGLESSNVPDFGQEGGDDSDALRKLPQSRSAPVQLLGDDWPGVSHLSSPRLNSDRPGTSRSTISNFRHRLRRLSGADGTPRLRRASFAGEVQDPRGSIPFGPSMALDVTSTGDFSRRLGFEAEGFSSHYISVPESKRPTIARKLQEREAEFTTVDGVGIFCGTWNVNAKKTDCSNPCWLREWLCPKNEHGDEAASFKGFHGQGQKGAAWNTNSCEGGATSASSFSPSRETDDGDGMQDVYAVGLQEVVDLNAVNVAIDIRSQKRSMEWEDVVLNTLNFAAWEAKHGPSLETTIPSSPPATETSTTNAYYGRPSVEESMDRRQGMLLESEPIPKPSDFSTSTKTATNDIQNPGNIDYIVFSSACEGAPPDGRTNGERHRTDDEQAYTWAGADITRQTLSRNHSTMGSSYGLGVDDGGRNDAVGRVSSNQQDTVVVDEGLIPTEVWRDAIAPEKGASNEKQRGEYERAEQGKQQQNRQQKGESTFVLVAKEHLVGTWLAVFVRLSMLPQITDVRTGTVSAGMMGVMGNKGGVSIRLRLRDSSMCFVCSHLAAHRDNVQARNNNYLKIFREMVFHPLDASEWHIHQNQQRRRHRRGSSSPSSPSFLRRLNTSMDSIPLSPGSRRRRRLSLSSFGSLSISTPRWRSFSPPLASEDAQLVARSLSPPGFPRLGSGEGVDSHQDGHREQKCLTSQFPMEFEQPDIGAACQRRESLSMPNASTLLSKTSSCGFTSPPTTTPLGRTGTIVTADGVALGAPASSAPDLPPRLMINVVTPGGSAGNTAGDNYIAAEFSFKHTKAAIAQSSLASGVIDATTPTSAGPSKNVFDTRDGQDGRQAYRGTGSSGFGGRDVMVTHDGISSVSGAVEAEPLSFRSEVDGAIARDGGGLESGQRGGQTDASRQNFGVPRDRRRRASDTEKYRMRESEVDEAILSRARVDLSGGSLDGSGSSMASEEAFRTEQSKMTTQGYAPQLGASNAEERLGIQDHDVVFWFGDLNYRIDSSIAATEVLRHALAGRLNFLAENDQLRSAREAGDAFLGFQEGAIDFLPTYKYTAGTDEYDLRNDKKFRAPAWCDRVLFWTSGRVFSRSDEKGLGAGEVAQLGYRRSETPSTSDHKPVSASFRFGCKKVDVKKYAETVTEMIDDVCKGAGDDRPQVDIDEGCATIDFGDVRYKVPESRTVIIRNSGRVAACFTTIFSERGYPSRRQRPCATGAREPRGDPWEAAAGKEALMGSTLLVPDQAPVDGGKHRRLSFCEEGMLQEHSWYSVFPDHGTLLPEESLKITFRLLIEDSAARALASGRMSTKLKDILVIKIYQGKDRYFSLTASYTPSVYGSSLEAMVKKSTAGAIRGDGRCSIPLNTGKLGQRGLGGFSLKESGAHQWADVDHLAPNDAAASVTHQIMRMVDALLQDERKCQQSRLFIEEGVEEEVWSIREALDSDTEFSPHCAHSMIEALVSLLASLSPAVIPVGACPYDSESSDSQHVEIKARAFLRALPRVNHTVFVYLVSFFRTLLTHSSKNGLTVDRLVLVQRFCLLPDARRPSYTSGELQDVHGRGNLSGERPDQFRGSRRCGSGGGRGVSGDEDILGKVLRYLLMNESTWT